MNMFNIEITFYREDKLQLNMTTDEYNDILKYIVDYSESDSFVTFNVENGVGEITFKPSDIKYIKYWYKLYI